MLAPQLSILANEKCLWDILNVISLGYASANIRAIEIGDIKFIKVS